MLIRLQIIILHYNRKAAKIFALSSGKIDICEYLTGKEILSLEVKTM